MITFAIALAVLYLVFWVWHSPRGGKLTKAEIDRYLAIIERRLVPAEEVKAFTSRVRAWAEADDGRPVYMFNLIHFLPQFRTFPGAPEFKGTPQEANAYYEKSIMWLWRPAPSVWRGICDHLSAGWVDNRRLILGASLDDALASFRPGGTAIALI